MSKLNSREFFLVNILVFVVIAYIGILLILVPRYSAYGDNKILLNETETAVEQANKKIDSKSEVIEQANEKNSEYKKEKAKVMDNISNEQIGKMITELLCQIKLRRYP